jgi:hypothetical protein
MLMNQSKPEQNKSKRFEEYEDGLWQVLMYNYAEHEGKELLEETAPLKDDPQYQPSDAERKKFRNMVDGELRRHKIRSLVKKSKKIITNVAVVVLVIALLFAVMFTTVEAFRVRVLNFILTFEKEYTTVRLGENGNSNNMTAGFSNIYVPTYIPDGYWIDKITNATNFKIIEYINGEEKYIKFNVFNSSITGWIDTENAETIKSIKINGLNGLFVLKSEFSTVSWSNDELVFTVIAELTEEEIMKIAESVVFIE